MRTIVISVTGPSGSGKSLAMAVIKEALEKYGWKCSDSTFVPCSEIITAEREIK
jgi:DNA replication protein DnaC